MTHLTQCPTRSLPWSGWWAAVQVVFSGPRCSEAARSARREIHLYRRQCSERSPLYTPPHRTPATTPATPLLLQHRSIAISVSGWLSVRLRISKLHSKLHQIFCASCLWPWLGPALPAVRCFVENWRMKGFKNLTLVTAIAKMTTDSVFIPIDTNTQAGSAYNRVTDLWPFDLMVNACHATAMSCMSNKSGIYSSTVFLLERGHTKRWTDRSTQSHRHHWSPCPRPVQTTNMSATVLVAFRQVLRYKLPLASTILLPLSSACSISHIALTCWWWERIFSQWHVHRVS